MEKCTIDTEKNKSIVKKARNHTKRVSGESEDNRGKCKQILKRATSAEDINICKYSASVRR